MNTYKPFVSDDLVSRCLEDLKKVWRHTEYEQLLEEAEVKADEKVKKEARVNMQLRLEAVVKWLTQLEEAAGDNKGWWEQWMYDVDDGYLYPDIDLEWYWENVTALKVQTAIQFSIYLLKDAERPWNVQDSVVFVSSKLIQLCYKLCEWVGIDTVLSTGGDVLVALHLKALCLYIALRNEQNKLNERAERYGIHFKQEPKPKKEKQPAPSVEDLELMTLREKIENWKDDVFTYHAKRIYGIAAGERKYMHGTGLGYKWIYGAPNKPSPTHLAFFLLLIYNNKENIPWKKLQILFEPRFDKPGETQVGRVLRGRADQLRNRTDWYKYNKNKLWGFKYTDFPPHFPTWAKEIYLYVSDIENRIEKEKSAKSKKEKKEK